MKYKLMKKGQNVAQITPESSSINSFTNYHADLQFHHFMSWT